MNPERILKPEMVQIKKGFHDPSDLTVYKPTD
jgi:hypothetical protein